MGPGGVPMEKPVFLRLTLLPEHVVASAQLREYFSMSIPKDKRETAAMCVTPVKGANDSVPHLNLNGDAEGEKGEV